MTQTVNAVYRNGQLTLLDPVGLHEEQRVKVIIVEDETPVKTDLTREEVEARLRAAGLLVEKNDVLHESIDVESLRELTPEERDRIGRLVASDRPVEDLISEDRGLY